MMSYLNNGYDIMKYYAKFGKFMPHSIIMPRFMTIGSQMPELDWGAFCPPPPQCKISCQNTPYKLGLTRLHDKRDDLDFHIVNFPFLSSNIPSGPSYGVYISQLIRYA